VITRRAKVGIARTFVFVGTDATQGRPYDSKTSFSERRQREVYWEGYGNPIFATTLLFNG
jgi:hypothetical protein